MIAPVEALFLTVILTFLSLVAMAVTVRSHAVVVVGQVSGFTGRAQNGHSRRHPGNPGSVG